VGDDGPVMSGGAPSIMSDWWVAGGAGGTSNAREDGGVA
jgi:hypothetical protein